MDNKPRKFTPTTKRIITGCLGGIGIAAVLGSAFGDIETQDTMVMIMAIITGFFSLLKGEE